MYPLNQNGQGEVREKPAFMKEICIQNEKKHQAQSLSPLKDCFYET